MGALDGAKRKTASVELAAMSKTTNAIGVLDDLFKCSK